MKETAEATHRDLQNTSKYARAEGGLSFIIKIDRLSSNRELIKEKKATLVFRQNTR